MLNKSVVILCVTLIMTSNEPQLACRCHNYHFRFIINFILFCLLWNVNRVNSQYCDPGTYVSVTDNIATCKICQSGFVSSGGLVTECTICPAGTYSSQGQCISCPSGTFSSVPGSSQCQACSPGFVSVGSGNVICTKCPAGTRAIGVSSCQTCPANHVTNADGVCDPCKAGFIPDSTLSACIPCPEGTYSNADTNGKCLPCAAGYFNTFLGNSKCFPCPKNYFSIVDTATNTTTNCKPCPQLQVTRGEGSAECIDQSELRDESTDQNMVMGIAISIEGFIILVSIVIAILKKNTV